MLTVTPTSVFVVLISAYVVSNAGQRAASVNSQAMEEAQDTRQDNDDDDDDDDGYFGVCHQRKQFKECKAAKISRILRAIYFAQQAKTFPISYHKTCQHTCRQP